MPSTTPPIGTAHGLHGELSRRGLELRPEEEGGRDDLLQAELAARLNLPGKGFLEALGKSTRSAEDYLHDLLGIAAPFARMFQEIWQYLALHLAPDVEERISIRFGSGDRRTDVDLQQFRVWADHAFMMARLVSMISWPLEALRELLQLSNILHPFVWFHAHQHTHRGVRSELPLIDERGTNDGLAPIVRAVLREMADHVRENSARGIPASSPDISSGIPGREDGELAGLLLEDLLPAWHEILEQWHVIPDRAREAAREYYEEKIAPALRAPKAARPALCQEALALLDLPFWKHRWHTYEIWLSVKALEALKDFGVRLRIIDGWLPLDGSAYAVMALLGANERAFVHVRPRTGLSAPHDRDVSPDLRISTDDPATNGGTVCIVGYGQRRALDAKRILQLFTGYAADCGHGGGVIMASYGDLPPDLPPLPDNCRLVPNVRPGEKAQVKAFQEAVHQAARRGGLIPNLPRKRFVLLDVSSSMAALYGSAAAQRGLQRAAGLEGIHLFRFNDGLVEGGGGPASSAVTTGGGTQLGEALRQLYADERFGVPDRLLIVTDGGHDDPRAELSRVDTFRQCRPDDLESELVWLNADR